MKKFWKRIQKSDFAGPLCLVWMIMALIYCIKGDAAQVAFLMGLSLHNHITLMHD